jgi:hypothetical protein
VDLQLIVVTGAPGILGRSIVAALTDANLTVGQAIRNPDMIGAMMASANLFSQPATAVGKGTICHFRSACG